MISPMARKQLDELPGDRKRKVTDALKRLGKDPREPRPGVDIKKLVGIKGGADLFRLRIGDYRVIYEVSEGKVWVSEIIKRGNPYKFLI